eukprot:UN1581
MTATRARSGGTSTSTSSAMTAAAATATACGRSTRTSTETTRARRTTRPAATLAAVTLRGRPRVSASGRSPSAASGGSSQGLRSDRMGPLRWVPAAFRSLKRLPQMTAGWHPHFGWEELGDCVPTAHSQRIGLQALVTSVGFVLLHVYPRSDR